MTTYYNRLTPYLLSSTLPDRSTNLLSVPDSEDFTSARKPFFDEVLAVEGTGNAYTSIYLDGWVGVALAAPNTAITNFVPLMVRVKNTGSQFGWVYWLPIDDLAATSAGTQYQTILPGQTVIFYARWVANQYNDPTNTPGAIVLNCPNGSAGTTMEVTVVQLDIPTVLTDLSITAA